MTIDRVTMTGADDSIRPEEMIALTKDFPFVEWGILASHNNTIERQGACRYPSPRWIAELQSLAAISELKGESALPNLALHINGLWVRRMLLGENIVPPQLWDCFNRVQLNFHAERSGCNPREFADCLKSIGKTFIFQLDGEKGNSHLDSANEYEVPNCYGLFDVSGGAGILPRDWPKPIYMDVFSNGEESGGQHAYHGYAGGLGPENLAEQIPLILEAAAGNEHTREGKIWIDMETRIRSGNDWQFDLSKVRQCLEIASQYVVEARP